MDGYPSIFGIGAPKFVYDFGGSNEQEIELDHVVIITDDPDISTIENKSVKTGFTSWNYKGKHWIFELDLYLFKYPLANQKSFYNTLKSFENTLVTLYKRRDGDFIKNPNDDPVLFFIEEIEERYVERFDYPDTLRIRFISQDPIDKVFSVPAPVWSAEASTYFDQLSTLPDLDIMVQIAAFIDGLVSDGVYAKIDEMWLLAMNTDANSRKGIKAYKECTVVGTPTFTAYRGWQGTGANYLRTNYVPSTDGINYSASNASMGVYSRTDSQSNGFDMGARHASSENSISITIQTRRTSTDHYRTRINLNTPQSTVLGTSLGFFAINRNPDLGTNLVHQYHNNSMISASSSLSPTAVTFELFIMVCNAAGTASGSTGRQLSFAFIGGKLTDTDASNLFTRLETLLDYIGAGVV